VTVRDRLAVSKQTTYKFRIERFILKKVNEVNCKEQHQVGISNRLAALEYFDDGKLLERISKFQPKRV
jgi:hypothetical protein